MGDNTVNIVAEDEVEEWLTGRADDISLLLDEREIEHETYVNSDGEDGWHMLITAGHAVHGSPLREYTVTYASADNAWLYQGFTEDSAEIGPHALPALDGRASAVEVAEHIAAEVGAPR